MIASKKMKQLQWEKVPKPRLEKTIWSTPEIEEEELLTKMRSVNLWSEMENEFKAKEIIYDAVKKRKETELLSVLASDHRKRIEILMAGSTAKSFKDPERLSEAIANFDNTLCTETFLRELQGVLPNDDDRGKLLTHSADSESELEALHPADRLMVRLIQLPHLSDRVKGMLFRVRFDQNVELLRTVSLIREIWDQADDVESRPTHQGMYRSQGSQAVPRIAQCHSCHGELPQWYQLRRRSLWFQSRQYQQGTLFMQKPSIVLTILAGRHEIVKWPESTSFPGTCRLDPFSAP